MLKTLRKLYEKADECIAYVSHRRISEEDMRQRAGELSEKRQPTEQKKVKPKTYRERWINMPKEEVEISHLVKNRCFICNHTFQNSEKHYEKYGNCCLVCNNRVNLVLKEKITKEELNNLLQLRIAEL